MYDFHKFYNGSRSATPLLIYNYAGNGAPTDLGRSVEIDSLEFIDTSTGQVLNAGAKMESGAAGLSSAQVTGVFNGVLTSLTATQVNERLRPWLVLVCVDRDVVDPPHMPGRSPLPVIEVPGSAVSLELPDLRESWAWAHTQVSGAKTVTAAELATLLRMAPQRVISRILVPRRLDPRVAYVAFIVPSFERGRLAGVRERVPDSLDGTTPAWTAGQTGVRLPVYYQWRFQTGVTGDFESLVRQLQARVLPPTVGIRAMDVAAPGNGLPAAHEAAGRRVPPMPGPIPAWPRAAAHLRLR